MFTATLMILDMSMDAASNDMVMLFETRERCSSDSTEQNSERQGTLLPQTLRVTFSSSFVLVSALLRDLSHGRTEPGQMITGQRTSMRAGLECMCMAIAS